VTTSFTIDSETLPGTIKSFVVLGCWQTSTMRGVGRHSLPYGMPAGQRTWSEGHGLDHGQCHEGTWRPLRGFHSGG
jgi:hypothetical protein